MAIQFSCPRCQTKLSMAEEQAGNKFPCPNCNQRLQVPQPPPTDKTMLGELDGLVNPALPVQGVSAEPRERPWPAPPGPSAPPAEQMVPHAGYPREASIRLEPHRGVVILVLGIVSLVIAVGSILLSTAYPIAVFMGLIGLAPGIMAWVMGKYDMQRMKSGQMDPEGMGLTQGGHICGMAGTIMQGAATACCIFLFVGFLVGIGASSSYGKKTNVTFQKSGNRLSP